MQSQLASYVAGSKRKHATAELFLKYFFVAVVALLVDTGVLSFLVRIGHFPLLLAAVIAFVVGAIVNYYLSVIYVFSTRKLKNRIGYELALFFAIGVLGVVITQCVLYVGVSIFDFNLEIIKLLAAGLTFIFNFVFRKIVLFS